MARAEDAAIGGLAFTWAPHPTHSQAAAWINALYVLPEYRSEGVATGLIRTAADVAVRQGISELFALTHVPGLYVQCGWEARSQEEGSSDSVVHLNLSG